MSTLRKFYDGCLSTLATWFILGLIGISVTCASEFLLHDSHMSQQEREDRELQPGR